MHVEHLEMKVRILAEFNIKRMIVSGEIESGIVYLVEIDKNLRLRMDIRLKSESADKTNRAFRKLLKEIYQ